MNKIDITKQLYAFALAGDWDNFESHIHPDFAVIESAGLAFAGTYKGVSGLQKLVSSVFNYFDDLVIEPTHYMEGDDHVAVIIKLIAKGKKTGKLIESSVLELFRFEGDKVIEIRPYYWHQQLINEI